MIDNDDFGPPPSTNGTHDFRVSVIAHAHDTKTDEIGFRVALDEIRSLRWKAQVDRVRAAYREGGKDAASEPKKKLPGILFSGTFRKRAASELIEHSGLICADLDELGDSLEAVFEHICSDAHTLAAFRSPTGTGLKVVFRCDPLKLHKDSFLACQQYVLSAFGLEIDEACKDVSRICFFSHDPEAFVADDAEPLPYPQAPKEFVPSGLNPHTGLELSPGDDYDARGDFDSLLMRHGWTKLGQHNWRRPEKTDGISATFGKIPGRFYNFSSSVPGLEAQHVYRPWHVYAILEHNGDFAAAAKKLGEQGFGHQRTAKARDWQSPTGTQEAPKRPLALQRKPSDFSIPPDGDSSVLLGNRYLNRGDGLILSGSSGMGKSSIQMQMAAMWAQGLPFHGVRCNGPLKSLIIQSEDSDGDVAEVWASIHHALKLPADKQEAMHENIRIITDRTNRGRPFLAALRQQIELFHPDLVWINPLQAFIDGDVTESRDLGQFLREGLNGINEVEMASQRGFGYVIIHHTTKPATGKDRAERLWHEVMYDMAGGAELINWARAIMSLRPTADEGDFNLVLAKRGRRAGVTRQVPQGTGFRADPSTIIPLRHSQGRIEVPGVAGGIPAIYWESRDPDPLPEKPGKSTGRPEKYLFADYRTVIPKKSGPGKPFNEILQATISNGMIPKGSLQGVLKRWMENGEIEALQPPGGSGPIRYRAAL